MTYDDISKEEKNEFLSHHGILGMQWGKQNGPPYPLDPNKDYSTKEKIKNKIKSITQKESKNEPKKQQVPQQKQDLQERKMYTTPKASSMYKNKDFLSNQEMKDYISRVSMEKQIKDLAKKEYDSEHKVQALIRDFSNKAFKKAVDDTANNVGKMMGDMLKTYGLDSLTNISKTGGKS